MSELEQVITWLRTYEGHDILKDWHVDYTDQVPSCGAVFRMSAWAMSSWA